MSDPLTEAVREVVDAREHLVEAVKRFDRIEENGLDAHTLRMMLVDADAIIQRSAFPDERPPLELVA